MSHCQPVAWMVYTQDGQSCYVTDNPADISPNQRALPLYTEPPSPDEVIHPAITHCDNCGCDWLDNGLNPVGCPYCKQSSEIEALRAEVDRVTRENEAMKRCAIRYLEWLGVTHVSLDQALYEDMHNPDMCGDAAITGHHNEVSND